MKILSGKLRGRNFYMPAGIRPTQDVTRKAIFDILGHDFKGIEFLDLFAGSGAVGLEAVSRGAKRVVFVEKDSHCCRIINENLTYLNLNSYDTYNPSILVINTDCFAVIKQMDKNGEKFHVVFSDPPYGSALAKKILKTLCAYDILHPNCFIILQHDRKEILPASEGRFFLVKPKRYGNTVLSLYEGKESG